MFNFTEEIKDLKISVDFNPKKEIINEIKFSGPLRNKYISLITFLESNINNLTLDQAVLLIERSVELKSKFPSPAFLLFMKWYKNIKGIVSISGSQEFICNCSGLTKSELSVCINKEIPASYGEVVAQTKATIACGSCASTLKNEYRRIFKKHFLGKINNTFFNELGDWISYKNLTPAEIILGVDDLINEWCLSNQFSKSAIEIIKVEGLHFTISVKENFQDIVQKLEDLEQFLFTRSGLLIILIY